MSKAYDFMCKRYITSFFIVFVLTGYVFVLTGAIPVFASTLTTWQNMVSNGTTTYFWYDSSNTFLNLGYDVDLSGFPFWSATTSTPSLHYIYLKTPGLNWDYSITIPTDSEGYKFWIIQEGGSETDRIFRYKSGGNWYYGYCTKLKDIILADKTLQLSRCSGVSQNPITNIYVSMGEPSPDISAIYLMVYTDDDLDILIYDETSMYAYLNNLANYNSITGQWTPGQIFVLPAGTCDDMGTIAGALCKVISYLFYPSQASLTQFSNLKDMIITKPPFGYFTSIKSYLNNLSSTSTPAFSLTSAIGNIAIFDTLKTGLAWILWLFFGFWVIKRIARFDF